MNKYLIGTESAFFVPSIQNRMKVTAMHFNCAVLMELTRSIANEVPIYPS